MDLQIREIDGLRCLLGEGPVWDVEEQALYFVDTMGQRLWRYRPADGSRQHWDMPSFVGSLALYAQGGAALLALANGFHRFDFASGSLTLLADPERHLPHTLYNDGKVDHRGRFVCGSVNIRLDDPVGALWRLDGSGAVERLDDGYLISNGPCWSPDGRTLYHADSLVKKIFAFDYDLETGRVAGKRVFADTTILGGIPDGATVDSEGRYWTAMCEAGKVVCFSPEGIVQRVIDVPAKWVSSVIFGGPALDQLYCTSINPKAIGRPEDANEPGRLFVIEGLGVRGLPEHRFAG